MPVAFRYRLLRGFLRNHLLDGGLRVADALSTSSSIRDGLETGLKVLASRRVSASRVATIMLIANGQQRGGDDAAQVELGDVPVYTFGFGADHDYTVLKTIADKSIGGVYNIARDGLDLCLAVSQILAGLLTIVAQDLKLTVTQQPGDAKIENVDPGSYPQVHRQTDADAQSVDVAFGHLFNGEERSVFVDLVLPAVNNEDNTPLAFVEYSYGELVNEVEGIRYYIARSKNAEPAATGASKSAEVEMEEARRQVANAIRDARIAAERDDLDTCQEIILAQYDTCEDLHVQSSGLVSLLRSEIQLMLDLTETKDMYEEEGRRFALSSETSHGRQRFAWRGADVRFFATPRIDSYHQQARHYVENPGIALPSADDDAKEEIAANPMAAIGAPLLFYLESTIQILYDIERTVKGPEASKLKNAIKNLHAINKIINSI